MGIDYRIPRWWELLNMKIHIHSTWQHSDTLRPCIISISHNKFFRMRALFRLSTLHCVQRLISTWKIVLYRYVLSIIHINTSQTFFSLISVNNDCRSLSEPTSIHPDFWMSLLLLIQQMCDLFILTNIELLLSKSFEQMSYCHFKLRVNVRAWNYFN